MFDLAHILGSAYVAHYHRYGSRSSNAALYSQAVKAAGLIFVSGTAPIDPATGQLVKGPVQVQVAQCLRNISAIPVAAGSSLEKAVSATLIVADEEDFAGANEEWLKWFPETRLPGKGRTCRSALQK
ncbi:MAG: RidA family protein [Mesorhizobium sp.]|nr:RidA family protein [Mesorhizobium sp.]